MQFQWHIGVALLIQGVLAVTAGETDGDRVDALPDPFRFNDGTRVENRHDWELRRTEITELLLDIQYGQLPDDPGTVSIVSSEPDESIYNDRVRRRKVTLAWGPKQQVRQTLTIDFPVESSGPCPLILRIGDGEPDPGAGAQRGYIFASFNHREMDPDPDGKDFKGPVQEAYPDDLAWGSIAVWAWSASRALDYLLTLPEVDPARTVITGHSRCGKAALLCGALDDRFVIVAPNGSGCGGAGTYRIQGEGSETLEAITRTDRFAAWFHPDFRRFAGREEELPFDQHFLRALVAPRAVISTDALSDHWANPKGTQAAYQAAQPVFDFLGVSQNNALHFREGGHAFNAEDYGALLDFMEAFFEGQSPGESYRELPFPYFQPELPWLDTIPG